MNTEPDYVFANRGIEDTAAAVEAERRRLGSLLQNELIAQLRLFLSQANAFERTLPQNQAARGAIAMLAVLARQILQQVQDLANNLQPTVLESGGLGQALEAFANQAIRVYGLEIALTVAQLSERLPQSIELSLYRAVQDAIEHAVRQARASRITVRLAHQDDRLTLSLHHNGIIPSDTPLQDVTRRRLEQLGGTIKTTANAPNDFELIISFTIKADPQLTGREIEVLQWLGQGLSNKDIARQLSISPRTVNYHLNNIYSKLEVNSRTEAIICALRYDWFSKPSQKTGKINR